MNKHNPATDGTLSNKIDPEDPATWPTCGDGSLYLSRDRTRVVAVVAGLDREDGGTITDGEKYWWPNGRKWKDRDHPSDLIERVKVEPDPFPARPEEPKPPREVWVNWMLGETGPFLGSAHREEAAADLAAGDALLSPRLGGHATLYVLPDEAGLPFSEEEIALGFDILDRQLSGYPTMKMNVAFRAALAAIAQHRSKRP